MQTQLNFGITAPHKISSQLIPKDAYAEYQANGDLELIELKLASSIRIQPAAFEAKNYVIEDPISFKNDVSSTNCHWLDWSD